MCRYLTLWDQAFKKIIKATVAKTTFKIPDANVFWTSTSSRPIAIKIKPVITTNTDDLGFGTDWKKEFAPRMRNGPLIKQDIHTNFFVHFAVSKKCLKRSYNKSISS